MSFSFLTSKVGKILLDHILWQMNKIAIWRIITAIILAVFTHSEKVSFDSSF